ncbi:sulfurtransferase-like selenium metabolism protein YedF [Leptotrichia sp. OH3620_COT-345]|uniref:sulfurtransferase-like selenium metabolism protein YedF n=1 Tax=Leptotrichia sp. OH3620_COT-345 TaxID=2491048 RepID=UPI000F64DA40|nr:sulfurtransferase-like selenium metabolism protein YedF [Leptotrichia sp. OH3620_COT-345]RRD39606.1 sulfurtransferase-like selenium metabolism protein YedF [Leptotrichia sp. OH3620_COT-345]
MKKYELNAKGMACPLPVIETKKLLTEYDIVETTVDNVIATQNLEKLATQLDYSFNFEKISDEEYKVTISSKKIVNVTENNIIQKDGNEKNIKTFNNNYITVINKKTMGHGSDELGNKLIKAYLYALSEQEVLPKKIVFYNEGAILVDKNRSHVLSELKELENKGVEIVCCGVCLEYYNVEIAIGKPTNMYFIVEDMRKNKVIHP